MEDITRKKICKVFITLISVAAVCSLTIFIPQVRNLIIAFGEKLIGRSLTHEVWHGRLISYEKKFFGIFVLFLMYMTIHPIINAWKSINCPKKRIVDYVRIPKFFPFLAFASLIYFVGIIAIIRANFFYIDDLGRGVEGYRGWGNFSRYLSNFFSSIIHGGFYLTDISPLPQIIAVICCGLSTIIIVAIFSENRQLSFTKIVAAIPLGLSPYFLECLSYKYDAPYMALSVLVSIIPFLFLPAETTKFNKNELKENIALYFPFLIASVFGILSMCMLYQASSGIYLMVVVLFVLKYWNKTKPFIFFVLTSIFAYLFGLIMFKLFFMQPADDYVSNRLPSLLALIPNTIKNFREYFSHFRKDYKLLWLFLYCVIFVSFVLTNTLRSNQNKKISLPLNFIFSIFIVFLSFGMYPFLSKPLFAPRAMYGIGILIALLSAEVVNNSKHVFTKIAPLVLSYFFFAFAFTYGNALSEQKRYTEFRIQLVIQDLNNIDSFANSEIKQVQLNGDIGLSPVIKNQPQNYQILNRLIPSTFGGNGWIWQQKYFYSYFSLKNVNPIYSWNEDVDLTTLNLPIIKDSMYHTIKGDNENFLIELK